LKGLISSNSSTGPITKIAKEILQELGTDTLVALKMDMDLNILPADKCSANVISMFLPVLFFCDDTHQCSIPVLDKRDKLTTPKKQT